MAVVKLITLDLDNTLWDVERVIVAAEKKLVKWLEQAVPESLPFYQAENLARIREDIVTQYSHKTHDLSFMRKAILFEVMCQAGLANKDAQIAAHRAFDVFFEGRNEVQFFPGAIDLLQELSQKFTLYALTNGNADIHRTGLGNYLTGAFSSADVGHKKPDKAMFHAPLTTLQLMPNQAIHIGDDLHDDIFGASAMGMHNIWVNLKQEVRSNDQATPTQEVHRLSDVPQAIDTIINTL